MVCCTPYYSSAPFKNFGTPLGVHYTRLKNLWVKPQIHSPHYSQHNVQVTNFALMKVCAMHKLMRCINNATTPGINLSDLLLELTTFVPWSSGLVVLAQFRLQPLVQFRPFAHSSLFVLKYAVPH